MKSLKSLAKCIVEGSSTQNYSRLRKVLNEELEDLISLATELDITITYPGVSETRYELNKKAISIYEKYIELAQEENPETGIDEKVLKSLIEGEDYENRRAFVQHALIALAAVATFTDINNPEQYIATCRGEEGKDELAVRFMCKKRKQGSKIFNETLETISKSIAKEEANLTMMKTVQLIGSEMKDRFTPEIREELKEKILETSKSEEEKEKKLGLLDAMLNKSGENENAFNLDFLKMKVRIQFQHLQELIEAVGNLISHIQKLSIMIEYFREYKQVEDLENSPEDNVNEFQSFVPLLCLIRDMKEFLKVDLDEEDETLLKYIEETI